MLSRLLLQFGLKELEDLSFEAIQANVTVDNAVAEYFTLFSEK
jgi:hypothetical protein